MTADSRTTLRPATAADLGWARGFALALGLCDDGMEEQFGASYVVAETDGEAVGLGGVEVYGRDGLLRSVGVRESLRRSAVGRAIVADRLAWARNRGLRAVYLLTDTAPGFFERLGFERVARDSCPSEVRESKEFSEVCPESAVVMKLEL
jgi:amino-acid N-acetyltransferase